MKKAEFNHLLKHFRVTKTDLAIAIQSYNKFGNETLKLNVVKQLGALECLYFQALGNGLVNLAKGIRRLLKHVPKFAAKVSLIC